MLDGIVKAIHPLQEHALDGAQRRVLPLGDHGRLVQTVKSVDDEKVDRLAAGRRAHGDDRRRERFAALVEGRHPEKVERARLQAIHGEVGADRLHPVVKAASVGAVIDFVGRGGIADHAIAAGGRCPGQGDLAGSGIAGNQALGRLGQQMHRHPQPLRLVLDDALVDGPGRDLAKDRLPQGIRVAGAIVERDLQQDAGHGRQFAQLAKVGALLPAVHPARIPGGSQVGDQLGVNPILELDAARGRLGAVDIAFGPGDRAVEAIGVPRNVDGILPLAWIALGCLPLGVARAGDDVVRVAVVVGVDFFGRALVHDPVLGCLLPAGSVAGGAARLFNAAQAAAKADGIGDDCLAGVVLVGLVDQRHVPRGARFEIKLAQVPPGHSVDLL